MLVTPLLTTGELMGQDNTKAGRFSFDTIKQINADVLDVGYAEAGPANGEVVIVLHGWPYDIHSYTEVAALLAEKNYRVIVPLRGYGPLVFFRIRHRAMDSRL